MALSKLILRMPFKAVDQREINFYYFFKDHKVFPRSMYLDTTKISCEQVFETIIRVVEEKIATSFSQQKSLLNSEQISSSTSQSPNG